MAKLVQLIDLMADIAAPVGRETMNVYARQLRAARMISTGGRGPGGAEMTATDCAAMLCSVLGSSGPKDAVDALEKCKGLVTEGFLDFDEITQFAPESIDREFLLGLDQDHSFFAMIEEMINRERQRVNNYGIPFNRVDIEVSVPATRAMIRLWSGKFLFSIYYIPTLSDDEAAEKAYLENKSRQLAYGDMHAQKSVGIDSLYAFGDFLTGSTKQR